MLCEPACNALYTPARARQQLHTHVLPACPPQVLEKMSAGGSTAAAGGPKRAKLQQGDDLLVRVASKAVTEKTLAARLLEHIERIDTDMVRQGHWGWSTLFLGQTDTPHLGAAPT